MRTFGRMALFDKMLERIERGGSILDIGAGIRPAAFWKARHICIEPHDEYVSELALAGYEVLHGTAKQMLPEAEATDTTFMLDVIEHMEKEEGLEVLEELKRREGQVVIFTPLGFMKQEGEGKDPWGYNGWAWQKHRSGWLPQDFPGYSIIRDDRFHKGCGAFFAIRA